MAVNVIEIPVSEFIQIPDNPRQRDTERHSRKALHGHLAGSSPTHKIVAAASIDGNIACKLDGHTRAYLWETGDLGLPENGKVHVVLYPVSDLDEACELYTHFDNQAAMEASCDRLYGACRENSLDLTSGLLRPMKFAVALRLANAEQGARKQKTTEYDLVGKWAEPLTILDSWQLPTVPGPLIGLALLMIRNGDNLEKVKDFYTAFCEDRGNKTGKDRDGVQALTDHLNTRRSNKTLTGWDNLIDFAERGYSCVKAYVEGRMISGGVRRSSLKPLIKETANSPKT